jgi:hypothetical protein
LTNLSQFNEVFWTNKSKVAAIAKFQDRLQQVHRFFDKCHAGLRMIWKAMFRQPGSSDAASFDVEL